MGKGTWCYVAYDIDEYVDNGIYKKIKSQSEAIKRLAGSCDLLVYGKSQVTICKDDSEFVRVYSENDSDDIELLKKYDFVYIRWGANNHYFQLLLHMKKELGIKVVVELPTYPIKTELQGKAVRRIEEGEIILGVKAYLGGIYLQDVILRRQLKKIDYLVLISFEKDISGVNCIHIDNGIDVQHYSKRKLDLQIKDKIIMMVVANLSYWHGIDRVIEGLSHYHGNENVEFRIVGDGQEKGNLENLVKSLQLEDSVKFLGVKVGADLDRLYDECDVAIGSVGLSRNKIVRSTLKTREYMARGIPFVASEYEKIGDGIEQYVHIVDDDSVVNIDNIVSFINGIEKEEAAKTLRAYAAKNCSWDSQISTVINSII